MNLAEIGNIPDPTVNHRYQKNPSQKWPLS
jgi:hypothetical protein